MILPSFANQTDKSSCDIISVQQELPEQTREHNSEESCFVFGSNLFVEGRIGHKVLNTLKTYDDIKGISLHSPGGSTSVAIEIGKLVREKELITWMRPQAVCASSCTLVFQAGARRYAGPDSLLFYHCVGMGPFARMVLEQSCGPDIESYDAQCSQDLNDFIEITTQSTKEYMAENHLKYGMSQEFYDYFFSEKAFDDRWFEKANFCQRKLALGSEDALRFNIVQEIKANYLQE